MTTTETTEPASASRLIDSIQDTEQSALEAVRRFIDTVDDAFPDLGEDSPRRKIIDSAFKMTEQLVTASNRLAQNVVKITTEALDRVADEDADDEGAED